MSDIFISYKREDQTTARKLGDALESEGWSVLWDLKVRPGDPLEEVIENELNEAKCVIVIWSKFSVQSQFVRDEASYALDRDKLVPVAIENVNLPFKFRGVHTLSLLGWDGSKDFVEFRRLVEDITAIVGPSVREAKLGAEEDNRKRIFISYRREDSSAYAQAIYRELVEHFSKDQVFMDVDTVKPGVDFVRVIEKAVGECDVLLAVIGKRWAGVRRGAKSRLEDPNDFVRLEISTALARDIRVIPVLVDAMRMPSEKILPTSLKALTRRNAMEISHTRFKYDVEQVVTAVRHALGVDEKAPEDETELLQHLREQMLLSPSDWELRKALYELDAHLAKFPHSTEARLLRQQIEDALKSAAASLREKERKQPGTVFRDTLKDGSQGPEMVVIPAGTFQMGDINGTGNDYEKPVHTVNIPEPFAIGRYPITLDEYDRFAAAAGRPLPDDQGWGRGRRPAINVSWDDAVEYAKWLSGQTGKRYRLPIEAEWEYAARAGTETDYWWGNEMKSRMANYDAKQTSPVGAFQPNPFGLYDTAGNVWEWVEDCWHGNYEGAPTDGSAWLEAHGGDCGQRVIRGGSWGDTPEFLRASFRGGDGAADRSYGIGFRLAQDID